MSSFGFFSHCTMPCFAGEGIKVVASILNKSSRHIRPKYCLYRKYSYFAKHKRKVETKDILKEVGDEIPPSAGQTVTRILTIPPSACPSILNCSILKNEYRLRVRLSSSKTCLYVRPSPLIQVLTLSPSQVYLDVKYTSDPVIKFPIVILSAFHGPEGEHPTNGSDTFGGFYNLGETGSLKTH